MAGDVRAVVICDDCQTVVVGKPDASVLALRTELQTGMGGHESLRWHVMRGADSGREYDICPGCYAKREGGKHGPQVRP